MRCVGARRRPHPDAHALALDSGHQRAEIAVAREKHHVIDMIGHFHGIDSQFNIHRALDLTAAHRVDEFLCGLGDDREAIVIEPVDQRADGGIFLILDQSRVIKSPQQRAFALKLFQ